MLDKKFRLSEKNLSMSGLVFLVGVEKKIDQVTEAEKIAVEAHFGLPRWTEAGTVKPAPGQGVSRPRVKSVQSFQISKFKL